MIGSMAMAQACGITCAHSISRSYYSGRLQQPVVVPGNTLSRPSRTDSTLRFARPSYNIGAIVNLYSGLTSSFYMPRGASHMKAGKKSLTTLGYLWQRPLCKGRVRCQLGGASSSPEDEIEPEENVPSTSGGDDTVQFDLDLPRRSVLLEFTCNVCKARTQRMINPYALRRGTVYVQCEGCHKYHQLVDNLNLVDEYDFRNEVDPMTNDLGV